MFACKCICLFVSFCLFHRGMRFCKIMRCDPSRKIGMIALINFIGCLVCFPFSTGLACNLISEIANIILSRTVLNCNKPKKKKKKRGESFLCVLLFDTVALAFVYRFFLS